MSYSAISIGLFIFILAYFTWNAPVQEPIVKAPEEEVEVSQYCQPADADAPTFKAPADNATKTGSEDDETLGTPLITSDCTGRGVRHQFSTIPTTYRLVRKNVPVSKMSKPDRKGRTSENFKDESCHFNSADKLNIEIPEVDTTKYKVFFPQIAGEISLGREIPSRTRGRNSDLLYLIDYGLVFLLHLDEQGNFIELKGGTTEGDPADFYLADVYQDIESPGRDELPEEALSCDTTRGAKIASATQVLVPTQTTEPPNDQLQLQYFVFGTAAGSSEVVNGWGIHCKPAIYLYPPKKQLVNVKVYPSGFLTYTDPPYDADRGWTVWANPDGKLQLINDERLMMNDYLYFESKIRDEVIKKPTQGWVVKYSDLDNHFKDILPKLGLNPQQTADFIEYWAKALSKDPAPYYFVGIIDRRNVNQIEKLDITPKPDSINRVRIYFERLDQPKQVEAPVLTHNPSLITNNQFSVVEWGGMVKNDPAHPFTCSQ